MAHAHRLRCRQGSRENLDSLKAADRHALLTGVRSDICEYLLNGSQPVWAIQIEEI